MLASFAASCAAFFAINELKTARLAQQEVKRCDDLTDVTPMLLYREWIVDTARKFNSPLGP